MKNFECVCGYVYSEEDGEPELGIAAETVWDAVPEDFECPVCGLGKESFTEM